MQFLFTAKRGRVYRMRCKAVLNLKKMGAIMMNTTLSLTGILKVSPLVLGGYGLVVCGSRKVRVPRIQGN